MCFHPPHDPGEGSGSSSPQSFHYSPHPSLLNLGTPHSSHPSSSRPRPNRHTRALFQPSPVRDLRPPASVSTAQQQTQRQQMSMAFPQLSEAQFETFVFASPQARVSTSVTGVPIGGAAIDFRGTTPHSPEHFNNNALDVGEEVSSFTQYGYPFPHAHARAHALSFHQLSYSRDVGDEDYRNLQPLGLTSALPIQPQTQPEPTTLTGFTETFVVRRRSSSRPSVTTQSRPSRGGHLRGVPREAASSATQVTSTSLLVRDGRDMKTTEISTARKRVDSSRDKQGCLTCRVRHKVSPWALSFALVFHRGGHISHVA